MSRTLKVSGIALASIVLLIFGALSLKWWGFGSTTSGSPTSSSAVDVPPAQVSVEPPVASGGMDPERISIEEIGITARVEAKGTQLAYAPFLEKEVSSFGIPERMEDTTWWSDGPKPGSDGMAIVLGHTQVGGGYGVFNDIHKLKVGDVIKIFSKDGGAELKFAVTEVVSNISKSDSAALNIVLEKGSAGSNLALVTCGGVFDNSRSASQDNVVVFAKIID
ncbi:MAG: class F sortase [Mycobacteriaceae bacterium]